MFIRSAVRALTLAAATAAATACVPPPPHHLQDMGVVLDEMAQKEAEFGTMSVSSPQLANPGPMFEFNVTPDSTTFYNDAKNSVEGRAAEFQQEVNSMGLGVNVSLDPTVAAAYAAQLQQYQEAVTQNRLAQSLTAQKQSLLNSAAINAYNQAIASAQQETDPTKRASDISNAVNNLNAQLVGGSPTTLPSFPTTMPATAPSNLVSPPTNQIAELAAAGDSGKLMAGFQRLAATRPSPLSVADRTALVTAAGDTAVKAMFSVLGNPKLGETFRTKRVLFGVSTISVNPGWRTKTNYAADVAMISVYKWQPARATVVERFIKNPRIPALLRARLALDQGLALPADPEANAFIQSASDTRKLYLSRFWECLGLDAQRLRHDALVRTVASIDIPPLYDYDKFTAQGARTPTVAAVSPMTDVQTLDLSSSFRRQIEVAAQISLALHLAGFGGQAQAFDNYVNNLQQDYATLTPNVVANSYSMGNIFGFQVGPQLRAQEKVKAGFYSGPGEVLQRQSFPALIIFGFEANDLIPRLKIDDDGKLMLMEPGVDLQSVHNWVPINGDFYGDRTRLTETERLKLSYWANKYFDKAGRGNVPSGTLNMLGNRLTGLRGRLFGTVSDFSLPEEIVSPPLFPQVTQFEPARVDLAPDGPATILLAGQDLDGVDLDHITELGGAKVNSAQRVGNAIELNISVGNHDDQSALVFDLPSLYGDHFYSKSIPVKGRTPTLAEVQPAEIDTDPDSKGNPTTRPVPVIVTGTNLKNVYQSLKSTQNDTAEVCGTPALSGDGAIIVQLKVKKTEGVIGLSVTADQKTIYSKPIFLRPAHQTIYDREIHDKDGKEVRDTIRFSTGAAESSINAAISGTPPKPATQPPAKANNGTSAGNSVEFEAGVRFKSEPTTQPSAGSPTTNKADGS